MNLHSKLYTTKEGHNDKVCKKMACRDGEAFLESQGLSGFMTCSVTNIPEPRFLCQGVAIIYSPNPCNLETPP